MYVPVRGSLMHASLAPRLFVGCVGDVQSFSLLMQSMFSQGNVVILQSKASKKSLRINNGDVEGNGGRGELAQFRVHVKRPGVVSLQNVHESYNWLAIFQEQTIGTVHYKAHTVTHTGVCSNTPVKVLSVTCSLYMEYLHTTVVCCV